MGTRRLTRREIVREDPVRQALLGMRDFLERNGTKIALVLLFALLGAGGWYLWGYWTRMSERESQELFARALDAFHGTVQENTNTRPDQARVDTHRVFKSRQEQFEAALKEFDALAAKRSDRPIGVLAAYYAALSEEELGRRGAAIKRLEDLEGRAKDPTGIYLIKRALAAMCLAEGKSERAAELYNQLLSLDSPGPKEEIMLSLADLYQRAGRREEAIKLYRRVVDEYKDSVYAAQARRRLEALGQPVS